MKFVYITIFVLGLAFTVFGQDERLVILSGTLYDQSGAVIPGGKVTARNKRGEQFEAVSDEEGVYQLKLKIAPIGSKKHAETASYRIECDLSNRGFEKVLIKDFKVAPSYKGKMYLDIVFEALDPEPCGYSGADCLP